MPIVDAFGPKQQKQADLTAQIDGVKTTFALPQPIDSTTLCVFINGLKGRLNDTITAVSASTFTLSYSPIIGETITILYIPL